MTESVIRKATVGMKEADTSLNAVLNNLFNPLTRKRVKDLALGEEEEGKYVARLSREVDGSGRETGIANGVPVSIYRSGYASYGSHISI